jgi:tRNA (guanine6-N2)-methyltransferase
MSIEKPSSNVFYEAAVVEGLEESSWEEMRHYFGKQVRLLHPVNQIPGVLQFAFDGNLHKLLQLKTVLSLFLGERFNVPRPKALLGHQNLQSILTRSQNIRGLWGKNAFRTLHMAAAGAESSVMMRLAEEISRHNDLSITREEGDMLVRIRRPLAGEEGWEVLVRLSPRPLSVRDWRVCDIKGGLNAAAAHALIWLTKPGANDVFLNVGSGSGTLLIEGAAYGPLKLALGCDTSREALECAGKNADASGFSRRIRLAPWDGRALPLADSSVDVLCSDLPFGHDVGSHTENEDLYPLLLREASRVTRPGGRALFLTHEVRLMTNLLEELANGPYADWTVTSVRTITLVGLHPRVFLLERNKPAGNR